MDTRTEQTRVWPEPVYVQAGLRSIETIGSPAEALIFLSLNSSGPHHRHEFAKEICAAAVTGHVSPETARTAFVEALTDANIAVVAPD